MLEWIEALRKGQPIWPVWYCSLWYSYMLKWGYIHSAAVLLLIWCCNLLAKGENYYVTKCMKWDFEADKTAVRLKFEPKMVPVTLNATDDHKMKVFGSVLFFSHPRSESWPHHGRTFSIYPCPLSFWLTLSWGVLSTYWCCPSRPCVIFLACMHLALFLALSLSPGNSFCFLMVWP